MKESSVDEDKMPIFICPVKTLHIYFKAFVRSLIECVQYLFLNNRFHLASHQLTTLFTTYVYKLTSHGAGRR